MIASKRGTWIEQLCAYLRRVQGGDASALVADFQGRSSDEVELEFYRILRADELEKTARREWTSTDVDTQRALVAQWKQWNFNDALVRHVLRGAQQLAAINGKSPWDNVDPLLRSIARTGFSMDSSLELSLVAEWAAEVTRGGFVYASMPVERYAFELRLVSDATPTTALTQAGASVLALTGRDITKLLIAIEVQLSAGSHDDWRISAEHGLYLLEHPAQTFDIDDEPYPFSYATLRRMEQMALVHESDLDRNVTTLSLTAEGRDVFESTLRRGPTPFTLRAAALASDAASVLLPETQRASDSATEHLAEYASMVAHEVGNKLAAMRLRIETIQSRSSAEGDSAVVAGQLPRLSALIENLQSFVDEQAQVAGAAESTPSIVAVAPALEAIAQRLKSEFNGSLEFEIAPTLPAIRGDRATIELVLTELVRNAGRKVDHERGRIRVSAATTTHGWLAIEVEDNGPGVPVSERESIFRPGVSDRAGGGRGLALVRRKVRMVLGGSIECSESTLGGAAFRVLVPPV